MRTLATFRLFGLTGGSAARITEALGVAPTAAHEVGDLRGRRSSRRYEVSHWHLSSAPDPQDDVELAASVAVVLDQIEPVADVLWSLTATGYWANWFCFVGSAACEHAVELDRDTLRRLLALPGELWLDVYGDDDGDGDGTTAAGATAM